MALSNEEWIVVQLKQENICFECENNTKIHLSQFFLVLYKTNKRKLEKFVHVYIFLFHTKMYDCIPFAYFISSLTQLRLGIRHTPMPSLVQF